MICCICNDDIHKAENKPYPLCDIEDTTSRCCDKCNKMVTKAKLLQSKETRKDYEIGDSIVIFYSKLLEKPTRMIAHGKFLVGQITDIKFYPNTKETVYEIDDGDYDIKASDNFILYE